MSPNVYVIIGIAARLLSILLILIFVLPQQYREIRRPRDPLTKYRWTLLAVSMIYIILSVLPFMYQFTRIDTESIPNLQNLASVSGNLALLAMAALHATIYIMARRDNRRK